MSNQTAGRERFVIQNGTPVLGGVFLSRLGIVVDTDTNPTFYNAMVNQVKGDLEIKEPEENTPYDIAYSVHRLARVLTPLQIPSYPRVLSTMASVTGKKHLEPSDEFPLSAFIGGPCICHQRTLLEASLLELLKDEGVLGAEVDITTRWTQPSEDHPDRHIQTLVNTGDTDINKIVLDAAFGIKKYDPSGRVIL